MQVVEDNLLELLVNLLLLADDNVALALDRRRLELRVLEDIGDDVDRGRDVLPEALRVVHGLLAGGVGVEMGTEVLDFELESLLRAAVRALEGKVLKEVSGSVVLLGLRARASVNPHPDRRRLRMGLRLGCDRQAIREGGHFREGGGQLGRCRI